MVERMPDPPFRPSRLLNLNKAFKANKAISVRNSVTSPLLSKLSPEIRARVRGYALGGNTIHLSIDGYSGRSVKARLCECPQDYDNISARCRSYDAVEKLGLPEKHCGCDRSKSLSQKVAFNLLLSCRQIHHEGALLPLAKNRFVVRSYDWALVPNFLQIGLNPTQIRAIQHLIVRCQTSRPASLSPGVALAHWSGLKTFEVLVDLALSPDLVASLKTTSSTSAHDRSGRSQLPSIHIGVDFPNGWHFRIGGNNQGLGPPDSRTINGLRSWQRGLESTLVVLPEQQRVEREAKEKAQKIAELAGEQAQKEQRAAVRSTRGLRNLEKKS